MAAGRTPGLVGTAPQARGAGLRGRVGHGQRGNSPAGAGSRSGRPASTRSRGEQPRGRGEQYQTYGARGTGAGSRTPSCGMGRSPREQPRGRGEQVGRVEYTADDGGTAPRARGAERRLPGDRQGRGNSPAGAGSRGRHQARYRRRLRFLLTLPNSGKSHKSLKSTHPHMSPAHHLKIGTIQVTDVPHRPPPPARKPKHRPSNRSARVPSTSSRPRVERGAACRIIWKTPDRSPIVSFDQKRATPYLSSNSHPWACRHAVQCRHAP